MSAPRPPIPGSLQELTAGWLTAALRRSGAAPAGARVTEAAPIGGLEGIAMTGLVARLQLTWSPPGAGPATLVAKLRNPAYADLSAFATEARFYRELAARLPLPAPQPWYLDEASGGDFVLLLEDLTGLSPGHPLTGCDLAESQALVDALAQLHAATWGGGGPAAGWPDERPDPGRGPRLTARFAGAWPELLAGGAYPIPDGLLAAAPRMVADLSAGLLRLGAGPRALVHRDLHVENLLIDRREGSEAAVYAIDWQGACLDHPAYDLANAIGGNTRPDVQREHTSALLARYAEGLRARGVDYPLDALRRDHRDAVVWLFAGQAMWLGEQFQPETERDRQIVTWEWERAAAALLIASQSAGDPQETQEIP